MQSIIESPCQVADAKGCHEALEVLTLGELVLACDWSVSIILECDWSVILTGDEVGGHDGDACDGADAGDQGD